MHVESFTEIARVDHPQEYENSGYVAWLTADEKSIGISDFSHCSCYGTWDEIDDPREYPIEMAMKIVREGLDWDMPSREMDRGDVDYNDMCLLYAQIIEWEAIYRSNARCKQMK